MFILTLLVLLVFVGLGLFLLHRRLRPKVALTPPAPPAPPAPEPPWADLIERAIRDQREFEAGTPIKEAKDMTERAVRARVRRALHDNTPGHEHHLPPKVLALIKQALTNYNTP